MSGILVAFSGAVVLAGEPRTSTVLSVTILDYGIWYWLLKGYELNQVMPLNLITPVFGLFAGIIFLSEPVAMEHVVGVGIVLLGVAIPIFEGRARPLGTTS